MSVDSQQNENGEAEEIIDGSTVMQCVLEDDLEKLLKILEENPDSIDLLDYQDEFGKSIVELACMLGRLDIFKEIAKRAPDLIKSDKKSGYSLVHLAACWGQVGCLEALFELGISIDTRTNHGESPKQLALRYNCSSCVDFIDWAAAKLSFLDFITQIRELVSDPEKLQAQGVKLTKDEKNTATNACNEKQEWLDIAECPSISEILEKKLELDRVMDSILNKNTSPVPSSADK